MPPRYSGDCCWISAVCPMGTPQSYLALRQATLKEVMDKKWMEKEEVRIEGRSRERRRGGELLNADNRCLIVHRSSFKALLSLSPHLTPLDDP